jgi:hypothetical protein
MMKSLLGCLLALLSLNCSTAAQESPFFVTYTHYMEEPGNLDLEFSTTNGIPRSGQQAYIAPYLEMEYGVTARWTSELYLEGQSTVGDSSVFTGWRWENRYKLLAREHWINPVLYLEYEDVNEASRIQKEIEGEGPDLTSPNALLTGSRAHELEGKLILSSNYHDWNIAENFTLTKNFSESEGIEFGYAFGVSHPLSTLASARDCRFCRENFSVGAEVYGGLGSTLDFGPRDAAHYFAPVISWVVSDNSTLRLSPGFGLTHETSRVLIRFGYTYEVRGFSERVSRLFGRRP